MSSIVYCHIGTIPEYIYESIYQTLSYHQVETIKIYIIIDKQEIKDFRKQLNTLNVDTREVILISRQILENSEVFKKYLQLTKLYSDLIEFRDGFWMYTTSRFFYIYNFMEQFQIEDVFHIENDVMIYKNLTEVRKQLKILNMDDKIVAVQDAPQRAICSIVYIPIIESIEKYSQYILQELKKGLDKGFFLNDMDLMGRYKDKYCFPVSPNAENCQTLGIYDGASIGQYLGGIDFKNINPDTIKNPFINPTKGFINETSTFKPNSVEIEKYEIEKIKKYRIDKQYDISIIHVHSKQLYLFSSIFDIEFEDIITGDRIIQNCDFVIIDQPQYVYNTNLSKYHSSIFLVYDFQNLNKDIFNHTFEKFYQQTGKQEIKLFIFIDVLENFTQYILPLLDDKFKYIIYSHNGDYSFDDKYLPLINDSKISKIYAQNIDISINYSYKVNFLPIGIARDVFLHGNLDVLYGKMINTYYKKKEKFIYVNINENTHPFRKQVMDKIRNWNLERETLSFDQYLDKLSKHYFCLCLRGNGIDTHRFWESLYLGVIPVIIYHSSMDNFIRYLTKHNIPCLIIELDFLEKNNENYFNQKLYSTILEKYDLGLNQQLKLSYYFN